MFELGEELTGFIFVIRNILYLRSSPLWRSSGSNWPENHVLRAFLVNGWRNGIGAAFLFPSSELRESLTTDVIRVTAQGGEQLFVSTPKLQNISNMAVLSKNVAYS